MAKPLLYYLLSYLRLRRSQMSAAIEPTTAIADNPETASISGTVTPPAMALTVEAIRSATKSQILVMVKSPVSNCR
jgi:hypothetical protein